jgi:transcription elongation factor Elf1
MKLTELMRRRTALAVRFMRRQPFLGKALKCPKCGKDRLGWTMKKDELDPKTRIVTFYCANCRSTDSITKTGPVFEIIDFYCTFCDRFNEAIGRQRIVIEDEQLQTIQNPK